MYELSASGDRANASLKTNKSRPKICKLTPIDTMPTNKTSTCSILENMFFVRLIFF